MCGLTITTNAEEAALKKLQRVDKKRWEKLRQRVCVCVNKFGTHRVGRSTLNVG